MKEYKFKINGKEFEVTVDSTEANTAEVTVNGASYKVEMENQPEPVAAVPASVRTEPAEKAGASAKPASAPAGDGKPVTSPLPGVIVEISVKEGDAVSAGQKVAVLEAMKMENEIAADKAGTVTIIHVAKGDSVLEGASIVTIA